MSVLAYIDSSVLLRLVFSENGKIQELGGFGEFYSSDLIRTECMRTCYRAKLERKLSDLELIHYVEVTHQVLRSIHLIPVSRSVLTRACQPFPIHTKTLDAIHLSTALMLQEKKSDSIALLTHDVKMGQTAQILGFQVIGV